MPTSTTTVVFGVLAALIALVAGFLFTFGIPSEWKKTMYEQAAEKMGENAAKDMLQNQIGKMPESDQKSADQISTGLSKLTGGDIQNPLGRKDD